MRYIYRATLNYDDFHNELNIEIQNDPDCQEFIKNMGNINLVEKKYFAFAGINEHRFQYFMLLANQDDTIYEWDTNEDTVREFGTLFDFLKYYRQIIFSRITGKEHNYFKELTTGRLL